MSPENEIIFLDTKIYIENGNVEFIKYRKRGRLTVLSNFKHSVMSMKYLKGNIFTALHRERDACSTHDIFLKSLEELKDVFCRNSYPIRLIEYKIKIFLSTKNVTETPPIYQLFQIIHLLTLNNIFVDSPKECRKFYLIFESIYVTEPLN